MSDPKIVSGLEGVLVTETRLSKVDGTAGVLTIGGFPLEELAPNATYEEVLHLLWYDRLPTTSELDELRGELAGLRTIPEPTIDLLTAAARKKLPTMVALRMGVDTLTLIDVDPSDISSEADMLRVKSVTARIPTVVATYRRLLEGEKPIEPNADIPHAANYLYMLKGEEAHPDAVRALETYINTVVDHGMNNSTFTSRVIISTRSDIVSAVVGAIGSLKGPLHGGAPGPALDMVFEIRKRAEASGKDLKEEAESWAREVVGGGGRIMGFGHRVYKVRDPRADVLGRAAVKLFEGSGDTALYDDATAVEDVVLDVLAELKPDRSIKTNVEFYTALILHGVGMESDLFSPTFAVGRVGGWTAHILEQIAEARMIRPRAAYSGELDRVWSPIEEREDGGNRGG
ncbi:MAG: citrate synthase/methylcitrate synthase [Chloroflexi bacterium]|nr:citrate synthase/methylcitrate synthase [Chloroflexota bacterium]MDK1045815.1 citrate/2-methylcitrate synthase [Anaerolineales bacterium]MCH8340845.1 citrate synthase/methylcitrate synthase [Chloroflexota bacterium]MCI0773470.1 citrate synthase/methylcitrate synthase [Chloroflexota bacterium]MCI0807233.1 citrate synthase/methylcitrate synthase [Chloroflexota bacterium]